MSNHNRREFLKFVGSSLPMVLFSALTPGCKKPNPKPNIVYILADDLGYGDVECLNPESKIKTPNINKLAKRGITFTDAHSGSAVCSPTRYGLLTGRYAWRSKLKSGVLWPWDGPLIEQGRLTVADFLKQNGYSTACIGKWHLGWDWPTKDNSRMNSEIPLGKWDEQQRTTFGEKVDFARPIKNGPTNKGFDYYFGDDVPNFPPYCFIENDRTVGIPHDQKPESMFGAPGPMVAGWHLENVLPNLAQKAVEYISAKPNTKPFSKKLDSPFFLYFPLTAPHTPIAPEKTFQGTSNAGAYGDFVQQVDWAVGKIVQTLEKTGQAENTLFYFTSDNGSPGRDGTNMAGMVSSVRRFSHNPSYIYRGTKADIWEGGHRVPFFAVWPGFIKPNSTCEKTICHTDFFATCAALVRKKLPDKTAEDSFNVLPALLGEKQDSPLRGAVVSHSSQGMFAIREGKWKLIEGKGSGGWSKGGQDSPYLGQLYDILADPGETKNLYNLYPDVVENLTLLLEKIRHSNSSF